MCNFYQQDDTCYEIMEYWVFSIKKKKRVSATMLEGHTILAATEAYI
jgi:hypothetical protein